MHPSSQFLSLAVGTSGAPNCVTRPWGQNQSIFLDFYFFFVFYFIFLGFFCSFFVWQHSRSADKGIHALKVLQKFCFHGTRCVWAMCFDKFAALVTWGAFIIRTTSLWTALLFVVFCLKANHICNKNLVPCSLWYKSIIVGKAQPTQNKDFYILQNIFLSNSLELVNFCLRI